VNKKILDGFYTPKLVDEYIEDFTNVLSGYLDKSQGGEKTNILTDFLIQKEKDSVEYFCQKIS
jgi:hypothetical protein